MTDIRIRIATPEDAACVNAVYEHYITHTVATFNEQNKTISARAEEIKIQLQQYPFLIAESTSGDFLGFACAEPIRAQSGYRYCAELTIYLHPDAPKGIGIGSALYTCLLRMLKEQGFFKAVGVIHAENAASIALHKRFGFFEAARFSQIAYKHGRWLDAALYVLHLQPPDQPPALLVPFAEYRKTLACHSNASLYLNLAEYDQK